MRSSGWANAHIFRRFLIQNGGEDGARRLSPTLLGFLTGIGGIVVVASNRCKIPKIPFSLLNSMRVPSLASTPGSAYGFTSTMRVMKDLVYIYS